jgi:hypothetical protein
MISFGIISSSRRWRFQPEIYPYMEAIGMPNNNTIYHEGTVHEKTAVQIWNRTDLLLEKWKIGLGLPLDVNNLKTRVKLALLCIGGTATSHKYNIADVSTYEASFYGGWTHDGSGMQPNGTNAYMTSTQDLFSQFRYGMESATFGFDSKTDADGFYLDMYSADGARPTILLYGRRSGSIYSQFDSSNISSIDTVSDSQGLYILNRVNANLFEVHKENILVGSHAKSCGQEITNVVLYSAGLPGSQFSPRKRTLTFGACKVQGIYGGFSPTERTMFTNEWRSFDNYNNR